MNKEEQRMVIKFEGQSHQLDINTLTSSLLSLSDALKGIKKDIEPAGEVSIRIDALAQGSFEIHTIIEALSGPTVTSIINGHSIAENVAKAYKGLISFRNKLSGKTIVSSTISDDKKNVTVNASDGTTIVADSVVFNIYSSNQAVNDSISEQFRIVSEDPAVSGFAVSDDAGSVEIEQSQFEGLSKRVELPSLTKRKTLKENQALKLVKAVFESTTTRRWEFIWDGNKIAANITDSEFLAEVSGGTQRFGAGDTLLVDIEIDEGYHAQYDAWIHLTYHISKVYSVTERQRAATQEKLL